MVPNNMLHEHSLQSSALELKYERSSHIVDLIAKDEDIRHIRFNMHILQDDNDELRDLLAQEEDRSNNFEVLVSENLARAQDAEARLQDADARSRTMQQTISALQAEKRAWKSTAVDSETFLTEKLALDRELAVLRPELEHLKAQSASTEALMTEKLELQRQVTNMQCELENAKRDLKRSQAKRRNTCAEIAQEEQVEDLKRQIAKERRARQRAEEAAQNTQDDTNIDDVRKELARERRTRQKMEEELEVAQENTQIEDIRKELLKEKKTKAKLEASIEALREELKSEKKTAARVAQRVESNTDIDGQVDQLRKELSDATRERAKLNKALQKAADDFETDKATLNEKLDNFRTKLRSTKDKLKETEAQLATVRAEPAHGKAMPVAHPSKKRNGAQFDADATTLGTPGDGPVTKRGRKAPGAVGEKSTFSITPFLNKTASIAPESPKDEAEHGSGVDEAPSPTTETAATKKKQPLAPKSISDSNVPKKPTARQRKQKATMPALEMVTEEAEDLHSQGQENANKQPQKVKTKISDGPDPEKATDGNKKKKIRKSLVDFASFDPEPEVKKKEKKSRKLGGLGKTLFDEEDEAAVPVKALPGRALLGGRTFGVLGVQTKKAGGFLGGSKLGASLLMTAADGSGFQFSPLKRRKGNLDDTLRG